MPPVADARAFRGLHTMNEKDAVEREVGERQTPDTRHAGVARIRLGRLAGENGDAATRSRIQPPHEGCRETDAEHIQARAIRPERTDGATYDRSRHLPAWRGVKLGVMSKFAPHRFTI